MSAPRGLHYVASALDESQQQALLLRIEGDGRNKWAPLEIAVDKGRRVQQFGYRFDYRTDDVVRDAHPFPSWLARLGTIAEKHCLSLAGCGGPEIASASGSSGVAELAPAARPGYFNQCIVNDYLPGQRISPHTDAPVFGGVIVSFSLGCAADMRFSRADHTPYVLRVAPGSLYVMAGEARRLWRHEMLAQTVGRRISVTFRRVEAPVCRSLHLGTPALWLLLLLAACTIAIGASKILG